MLQPGRLQHSLTLCLIGDIVIRGGCGISECQSGIAPQSTKTEETIDDPF
jgi:hypothetical protein